ncbi:hypothetical protein AURDEDRAFT_184864 [Auricularia subglabra TFB-10046 SS5]|nr:hypothetical protein AURDEDRAFT_184864 [Auricularia subglabra TFB-10046 SS5]
MLGIDDAGIEPPLVEAIFGEHFELPALESLSISSSFSWNPNAGILFPSVRNLSLTAYDSSELGAALHACPELRNLRVTPFLSRSSLRDFRESEGWDPALGPLLRRVPKVTVEIWAASEGSGIGAIFQNAPGSDLVLYYPISGPNWAALRLLRSLAKPIRVSCTVTKERRVVALFSDLARTLSFVLLCDEEPRHPSWKDLPRASVERLDFDLELWPGIVSNLPDTASVEELTLRFLSAEDVHRVVQRAADVPHMFPSISTIRLHRLCAGVVLDAARVLALIDTFKRGKRLWELGVRRVGIEGSLHGLSSLADTLRLS